jgi:predicted nucleic acid-binding protein
VNEGRGLLDTSVIIVRDDVLSESLPTEPAISSVTLAELATGPRAAKTSDERAARQQRLQQVEAAFDPLPFDAEAARAYARLHAAVLDAGRQPRGRLLDLQIAAVAMSNALPLYTRNPGDFRGLEGLVTVVAV